jgi:hypothetical protein
VNWPAPSYSPRTGLFYVQAQDDYAQVFFKLKPNTSRAETSKAAAREMSWAPKPQASLKRSKRPPEK